MSEQANKRAVLIVATMSAFIAPFMGSAINVALPTIGNTFTMQAVLLSWVVTIYLLTLAVFLVPMGKLADIYGRKRIFLYGVMIYTLGSLLCAIAYSPTTLIFSRGIQGFGASMLSGISVAIVTSVFPPGERGKVLGINVAAVYSGLSCGPFIGGLLTHHLGWRYIFFLNVPFGFFLFGLVSLGLKGEWAEARGAKFDLPGSIVYGLTLIGVILGLTMLPALLGLCLLGLGLIGFAVFISWEARAPEPVLETKLFTRNTVFAFSNLAALINYSAVSASSFLLSLYLQYIKGFDAQTAGLILIVQPVMQALFSPSAGKLSDKTEPFIVASVGMLFCAAGLFMFVFLSGTTGLAFIICSLVVIGFGFALFSSPNTNAVMSAVENRYLGVASATLGTMRSVGMTLSMGLVTMLFTLYHCKVKITPALYPQLLKATKVSFIIFTILCLLGIVASMRRGRIRQKKDKFPMPNSK